MGPVHALFWVAVVGTAARHATTHGGGDASSPTSRYPPPTPAVESLAVQGDGDLHAVIVSASRYWFNYRHTADALAVYRALRRNGVPDEHIVLMLADDHACANQNVLPGSVYGTDANDDDLYGGPQPAQVDWLGLEVTPAALLSVLSHRGDAASPSRWLRSTRTSRLLVYATGHSGDGFLKFHDKEELVATDLAEAIAAGQASGRYGEVMLWLDTCQAATLSHPFPPPVPPSWLTSAPWLHDQPWGPGFVSIASSYRDENSFAYGWNGALGQAVSDGFTRMASAALEKQRQRWGDLWRQLTTHSQWEEAATPAAIPAAQRREQSHPSAGAPLITTLAEVCAGVAEGGSHWAPSSGGEGAHSAAAAHSTRVAAACAAVAGYRSRWASDAAVGSTPSTAAALAAAATGTPRAGRGSGGHVDVLVRAGVRLVAGQPASSGALTDTPTLARPSMWSMLDLVQAASYRNIGSTVTVRIDTAAPWRVAAAVARVSHTVFRIAQGNATVAQMAAHMLGRRGVGEGSGVDAALALYCACMARHDGWRWAATAVVASSPSTALALAPPTTCTTRDVRRWHLDVRWHAAPATTLRCLWQALAPSHVNEGDEEVTRVTPHYTADAPTPADQAMMDAILTGWSALDFFAPTPLTPTAW